MSIYIVGDPHNQFDRIVEVIARDRPAAAILLGDMELEAPLSMIMGDVIAHTEIWWIHGNHDCDRIDWYDNLFEDPILGDRNLDGRVIEIDGLRVAGLGGVFRGRYWHPGDDRGPIYESREEFLRRCGKGNRWRGGLPLNARGAIWCDVYMRMWQMSADVLVTHEAPTSHEFGFREIDELALHLGSRRIFHGHQHRDYDDLISLCDTGPAIVHGVGLAGVKNEIGEMILPGIVPKRGRGSY